jgi:glycosyltransferase involved in cell wall biosynthesis
LAEEKSGKMIERSVSMIMPVYDEEDNIRQVVGSSLETLARVTDRFEVILVDDGSIDSTPVIIDRLAAADNQRIKVIHHARNKGYGAALISGVKISKFDLILFMDADRQYDINDIEKLVPYIDVYDIVTGYRLDRRDSLYRILLGQSYNLIINSLFGIKTKDINCGLKLFKKSVFEKMAIESSGALFYAEIFSKNKNFKEVGVNHYPRRCGHGKATKPKAVMKAVVELFCIWQKMIRLHRVK